MPAPPPESEPAMVRAIFTLAPSRSLAGPGLGGRGRQRVHRALQLVKHRGVLAAGLRSGAGGGVRRNRLLDVGDAIGGHGVGREELLDGAGVLSLHLLQDVEHVGEAAGVDAGGGGVPHAGVVRGPLIFPAEAREHGCRHDVQGLTLGRPRRSPEHDVAQPDAERRRALLLDLAGGVAQVHVTDLVAQHAGELIVAGGVLDQTARHVDVPARNRERVHVRGVQRRKARGRRGLALIEGVRLVEEALAAGLTFRGALVAPDLARTTRGRELVVELERHAVSVEEGSARALAQVADTEAPQGIVAVVEPRTWVPGDILLGGERTAALVIDGVQDPGNVGTLIRTAHALGAAGTIVLRGTADTLNPKALRAAMGATFRHPVVPFDDAAFIAWARQHDVTLWATAEIGRAHV